LELRLLLVAPPVRAGDPHELEVAEVPARVLDMWAPAQVDEARRVLVRAHQPRLRRGHGIGRRIVDDLELVLVFLEQGPRRVGADLVPDEGLLLLDDLPHSGLDAREVVLLEVLAAAFGVGRKLEVVVEAVLDGRPDSERGSGVQVEHGLGQDMGRRVPDRVEPAVRGCSHDGDLVAVFERPDEIALDAVDAGDHRRLAQARADRGSQIARGRPGGDRFGRAIGKPDRDLVGRGHPLRVGRPGFGQSPVSSGTGGRPIG
jgi:hypothetical protein